MYQNENFFHHSLQQTHQLYVGTQNRNSISNFAKIHQENLNEIAHRSNSIKPESIDMSRSLTNYQLAVDCLKEIIAKNRIMTNLMKIISEHHH